MLPLVSKTKGSQVQTQGMSLRRKTKIVRQFEKKLCERCGIVWFYQKGRARYCGSYKRKEGCSWIVRQEFMRKYLHKYHPKWEKEHKELRAVYEKRKQKKVLKSRTNPYIKK